MKRGYRLRQGITAPRMLRLCGILAFSMTIAVDGLQAQSAWEVTPYVTRVWLAVEDQPELPVAWRDDLRSELTGQLQGVFRAVWDGSVEPAHAGIRHRILTRLDEVSWEHIFAAEPHADQWDKLFLVAITGQLGGFRIQVREFDCGVSHFGPVEESEVDGLALVSHRVVELVARGFSPVVRIDRATDGVARTRLRAGSLIHHQNTPVMVQKGDVLLPFERRTGGTRRANPQDIRPIDWTYLLVSNQAGSSVECDIVTGFYQPLRAKRSRRVQQFAIRARRNRDRSVIRLQTRSEPPEPLIGYEVHEKTGPGEMELLGHTDWRGELLIESSGDPIRTLYLKSGNRVAAKLPVVPGLRDVVVAALVDDREQVAVERYLDGIQTALIDLVAHRESLTARIRHRIQAGDLDEAERLIEEFRRLPTQGDFQRQIQQRQQTLAVTDAQLRRRIDTLFVETYRILGKYLDSGQLGQLSAALASARTKP